MRSKVFRTVLTVVCFGWLQTAALAGPIHLPEYGFSIESLATPRGEADVHQALMLFLPASDGFAPNVNVQLQRFGGSLQDYIALSQQQFEEGNLEVLHEEIGAQSVIWEYRGQMGSHHFHWYAKAMMGAQGDVYLATATALPQQWAQWGAVLKQKVNSLRLQTP